MTLRAVRSLASVLALLALATLAACGEQASGPPAAGPGSAPGTPEAGAAGSVPGRAPGTPATAAAPAASLLLPADLPGAVPVLKALSGKEGDEVAVVGRVQSKVKGRALFHLVDDSVEDCTRTGDDDHCPTPWDYCCREDEMKASLMLVELRGADGLPLKVAALGIRELDLVAVRGTLARGEGGRLMLLARDGWYLRERPKVSARVRFPD
ncbi:MAG: hypothetical protein ACKOSS_09620 [Planctomycetia bacterium]